MGPDQAVPDPALDCLYGAIAARALIHRNRAMPAPRRTGFTLNLTLASAGILLALLLAEASLRWIVPGVVYIHPRFEVLSVEPDEKAEQMAGSMLGAALQYVDAPWVYRLKKNLRARFVSSEFDVAFATNDAGLRVCSDRWRGLGKRRANSGDVDHRFRAGRPAGSSAPTDQEPAARCTGARSPRVRRAG